MSFLTKAEPGSQSSPKSQEAAGATSPFLPLLRESYLYSEWQPEDGIQLADVFCLARTVFELVANEGQGF